MKGSEVPISKLLNESSNYPRKIESNDIKPDVFFLQNNLFARELSHTTVIERHQSQRILEKSVTSREQIHINPLHISSLFSAPKQFLPSNRIQESLNRHPIILPPPTVHARNFTQTSTSLSRSTSSSKSSSLLTHEYNRSYNRATSKTIEEKNAYRLERNRIAAKLSRDRKKIYIGQLETRTSKLSEENDALRKTVTRLTSLLKQMTDENSKLKVVVKELQAKNLNE
ncbi:588_t:CDS:1 [Ambispora leptoticha]|uniref:X-box-binding protein 1 n=1 Tax=Ambispora leptoticha TaxID=144679 RepID=A0A9N9FMS2_9GLOM|nr:588_t:CDS:1 [Ambispora leptoticha]